MNWLKGLLLGSPIGEYGLLSRGRILVIEDDPELKAPLESTLMLLRDDLQIHWVESADEILSAIESGAIRPDEQYDFVVSDIRLPGKVSGVGFWRYCRDRFPKLNFLMMSAVSLEEFSALFLEQGVIPEKAPPFLPKPFTLDQWTEAVGKLVDSPGSNPAEKDDSRISLAG